MIVLHDQDVEIVDSNENKLKQYNMLRNDLNSESYHRDNVQAPSNHRNSVQLPPMISLPENIPVGTSILRLIADDKDANGSISYRIIKETFLPRVTSLQNKSSKKKHFLIHSTNGEVAVATTLIPEAEYRLIISAFDVGGLTDNVTVRIYVKDINDHPPVFPESSYDFDLLEGVYSDHFIGKVEATDADYDENANVSYSITHYASDIGVFPFRISPLQGEIFVDGDIDREAKSSYIFKITATDHGPENNRLSTSVDVEIHITDINDNSPSFFGYDRLIQMHPSQLENTEADANFEGTILVPVYYTSVHENSALGTPVARIYANDSDFAGNGNGLLLYDIIHRKNQPLSFEIDSKEGIVTITNRLDYELNVSHNVTIVASDLGKPSLSSTALLIVNVIDVPEEKEDIPGPMFTHRYYEVEIEENSIVPLLLLTVNVTENFRGQNLKYSVVPSVDSNAFNIDPKNGTLYLVKSPDREVKMKYEVKIRVDRIKRGRGMATFIYPPPQEKIADLGKNVSGCIFYILK